MALFIVIAAGSYAFIGVAEEPDITIQNPDVTETQGDSFTAGGVEYTVENVSQTGGGGEGLEGGEGSGGAVQANVSWSEEVRQTESYAAGDTISMDDANWTVEIPEQDEPSTFRLVESFDVGLPTVEQGNTTYVIVERDGEQVLVKREQYVSDEFGEPETREYAVGDAFGDWQVDEVTNESVTVGRNVTELQSTTFAEGDEVELGGTTYVAHFPDQETVELTSDLDAYQGEIAEQQRFQQRITGLNYLAAICILTALLVLMLAFLPQRR